MKIANPIYDVVFKYLMENNQIAKDFLSLILGIEIISVEVQAQEFVEINKQTGLRVYRIDFKATVRDKNGNLQTILIEIQKSKQGLEVERFQSYIGLNYLKQNIVLDEENVSRKVGYPITPIYLLGFRLKNVKVPVLKVERTYVNAISRRQLKVKEDFVEKLSHDLYAIQIPRLKMQVRTDLEKMLDVFNSTKYKTSDSRIFDYTGDASDPRIARVVKHLGRAIIDDDNLLHSMLVEDEIEELLARERRQRELLDKKAQESLKKLEVATKQTKAAKEQAELAENKAELAENKAATAKEQAELAENKAELAENKAELAENKAATAKEQAELAENKAELAENKAKLAISEKEQALENARLLAAKVEALQKQLLNKK